MLEKLSNSLLSGDSIKVILAESNANMIKTFEGTSISSISACNNYFGCGRGMSITSGGNGCQLADHDTLSETGVLLQGLLLRYHNC